MPEIDNRVLRDVEQHGWHVVKVMEDPEGPAHAYSIGLFQRWTHPEIVCVGPDLDLLHQLINEIGERVRLGRRFVDATEVSGLIEGYPVSFRRVDARLHRDFLGYAGRYYAGASFPALQCVWPDPSGRFPWHADYPPELARVQPLLRVDAGAAISR